MGASNPGRLTPDAAYYKSCFDRRPLLTHQFVDGCVNPGIVVGPNLVAVWTDLSRGASPCPVVKIVAQPLDRVPHASFVVGTRLATCSLYYANQESDRWTTFHPIAVHCATQDAEEIARVTASISEAEWEQLERALSGLQPPFDDAVQYMLSAQGTHVEVHPVHFQASNVAFEEAPRAVHRGSWAWVAAVFGVFWLLSLAWVGDVAVHGWGEYRDAMWVPVMFVAIWIVSLWLVRYARQERVELYSDGLRWRKQSKWDTALWCDVHCYRVTRRRSDDLPTDLVLDAARWVVEKSGRSRFSRTGTILELELCGGRNVKFAANFNQALRMMSEIVDAVDAHVLTEAHTRLRHGLPARFGSMLLYPTELRWGEQRMPLDDVDKWHVLDGLLTMRMKGGKAKHYRIDNGYALDRLLREFLTRP